MAVDGNANISNLYTEHSQFYKQTYGDTPPVASGRTIGDTHINSNPAKDGYIGWVLTTNGWLPYGKIEYVI